MTTLILVPSGIEMQWLADVALMEPLRSPLKAWKSNRHVWAICGIGVAATALSTSTLIGQLEPSQVVLAGIAGAFTQSGLQLVDVVQVERDCLADLGYQMEARMATLEDMGLTHLPTRTSPMGTQFENQVLDPEGKRTSAITVNRITASQTRATLLWNRFGSGLEQMEGAGAAMACRLRNLPFYHVRAVSNFVGPRDPSSWKIQPACEALTHWLARHL